MLDEAVERASRGNVSKTHRAPRVRDEVSERQIVRR
jgi:hypothetical protein